ncbi:MAG TPA: hypothetical protein VF509_06775 [Sphingobium sp.]
MKYPLALLAISFFAITSAQAAPPMPTSLEAAEPLRLSRTFRMDRVTNLNGFAAVERGKCSTPVAVDGRLHTISVPIFVLISGEGQIARVVPLNTDCPALDTIAAKEQIRRMQGNTPVPADRQPHWYWTRMDFAVEFDG